jgi:hypothetical protein
MKSKNHQPILITLVVVLILGSFLISHKNDLPSVAAETITILSEYPYWTYPNQEDFSLFQNGTELGTAVSSAGDLNDDGYDDAIVGAIRYTDNVDKEGAVFLFLGSQQGLSNSPVWVQGGGQDSSEFGCAINNIGDINGDLVSDILVGACRYNTTLKQAGKIFVYFGGSDITAKSMADWNFEGDQKESSFGSAVSPAGDLNKDNFADFIVGAKYYDTEGKTNNGKAFVFFGGKKEDISISPDWIATGIDSYSLFGYSVSSAGDVDGNGYPDIIVGSPGLTNFGYAYVFLNSISGLEDIPSITITNSQPGAKFGSSVAGIGDVNHDGFDDVLIGSPSAKNESEEVVGCVYLYLGSGGATSSDYQDYDWMHCGDQVGGLFGATVAAAGNMNNDPENLADFLVGMPNFSMSNEQRGAIFLFFGSSSNPSGVDDYYEYTYGKQSSTGFGSALSSTGDVNNDSVPDVIVGAPFYKINETNPIGRVMAYYAGIEGIPEFDYFQVYIPIIIK